VESGLVKTLTPNIQSPNFFILTDLRFAQSGATEMPEIAEVFVIFRPLSLG
jgi:hypothetical protein